MCDIVDDVDVDSTKPLFYTTHINWPSILTAQYNFLVYTVYNNYGSRFGASGCDPLDEFP